MTISAGHVFNNSGDLFFEKVDRAHVARQLNRVVDYIETNLADALSVRDLAAVACLSPYHFGKTFKRKMGQTVHRYVTLRKIERAKYLLRHSDHTLAEIAVNAGFADQSHFGSVFRQYVNITPRAYQLGILDCQNDSSWKSESSATNDPFAGTR